MKHTTARKGKRIHVIMNDGSSFTDKLVDIKSIVYEFEQRGKVAKANIRSFSIAVNKPIDKLN